LADFGGDSVTLGAPGAAAGCGGGALPAASTGVGGPGKEASAAKGIFADFALAPAEAVAASTDACGKSARLAALGAGVAVGCGGGALSAVFVDALGDGERAVDGDPATPDAADWVTAGAEPGLALASFSWPLERSAVGTLPLSSREARTQLVSPSITAGISRSLKKNDRPSASRASHELWRNPSTRRGLSGNGISISCPLGMMACRSNEVPPSASRNRTGILTLDLNAHSGLMKPSHQR
jgi:hypothetical protein